MIDPDKQEMFAELAAEELEHKAALELEVMKLGQVTNTIDVEGMDKVEYEIEGDYVFDMEYADILQLAIEKEQAAFRLYASMASRMTDQVAVEMLLSLAEQEVKHKIRFEYEYENLLKKGQD
jgi:rubrerythrin